MEIFNEGSPQKLVKLNKKTHLILESLSGNYFLVQHNNVSALMYNFYGASYVFQEVSSTFVVNQDEMDQLDTYPKAPVRSRLELLGLLKAGNSASNSSAKPFSMRPPSKLPIPEPELPPEEPLQFLRSRYYSTLYSLNTPLSYFPKMALSRFKILCGDSNQCAQLLERLILSIEEMDERNQQKYGIIATLSGQESTMTKYELLAQADLIAKNPTILRADKIEEKAQQLFLELKIREAQLQMLLCLELLDCWKVDENKFITESQSKWEKERKKRIRESTPLLIRKKNSKRKIIPTFLGMGVISRPVEVNLIDSNLDELAVFKVFDTIIDRMGVWDTLLGRSGTDNDSAYGFLAFVLVPYFNKRLPLIVKYAIDKVKNLSMKLVTKSFRTFEKEARTFEKEAKLEKEAKSFQANSLLDIQTGSSPEVVTKPSKYKKVLLDPSKVPSLRMSKTFNNGESIAPAFSLKRSKSNLSSKNLQKREVDISISKEVQRVEEQEDSNTFIFGKAKRLKSLMAVPLAGSFSQVQTTPAKPKGNDNFRRVSSSPQVQATPAKSRQDLTFSMGRSFSQVQATPVKRNDSFMAIPIASSFSQVDATPAKAKSRTALSQNITTPRSGKDEFVEATPRVSVQMTPRPTLLVTPKKQPVGIEATRKSQEDMEIQSAERINSKLYAAFDDHSFRSPRFPDPQRTPKANSHSSIERNTKPGQPASIEDSPYYNTNLPSPERLTNIFNTSKRLLYNEDSFSKRLKTSADSLIEVPKVNSIESTELSSKLEALPVLSSIFSRPEISGSLKLTLTPNQATSIVSKASSMGVSKVIREIMSRDARLTLNENAKPKLKPVVHEALTDDDSEDSDYERLISKSPPVVRKASRTYKR